MRAIAILLEEARSVARRVGTTARRWKTGVAGIVSELARIPEYNVEAERKFRQLRKENGNKTSGGDL